MHKSVRKWLITTLKVTIAVVGLYFVARQVPWRDHVTIQSGVVIRTVELQEPVAVAVAAPSDKTPPPGTWVELAGVEAKVKVPQADGTARIEKRDLGVLLGQATLPLPKADLVKAEGSDEPAVQVGLRTIASTARPGWLLLALAIAGVPFFATAWRWQLLMKPQGIFLSYRKCVELTFVGQFYSTFLPGTTGGDLVKIIYTSRVVGSKTKSTITILLDRLMGLLALMFVALTAAAAQAAGNSTMRLIALALLGAFAVLFAMAGIYFSRRLRRLLGLEQLLNHPKLPEFVRKADDVLHAYRHAWRIVGAGFLIGVVSQLAAPLAAYFAGIAFHMDVGAGYYLAYVPVALLAASVPLTPPQGFGVLDYVVYYFFAKKGLASASQAFLLAQAIRFLPIAWNLLGAFWVVTGTYSRREDATGLPAPAVSGAVVIDKAATNAHE